METLLQDLRHALRFLRRSPGFTAAAVATLALGMGANTAMFSVVHAVMLRPLPYAEPDRLVRIRGGSSWPDLTDLQAKARTLHGLGGYRAHALDLLEGPAAERVDGAAVTGDLFRTLGVPAALGRAIRPEDDRPGGEQIVVLSHGFWQTRLGGEPDVLGRALRFSSGRYQVVGVMLPGFRLPGLDAEAWVPLAVESPAEAGARGAHTLAAVGRLAPGASLAQAQAELDAVAARLAAAYPEENTDRRYPLAPLHAFLVRDVRGALLLLLGAVSFVLLIAATNVANLLLVRAAAREREMAVRASLGAGRGRLLRQLLAESAVLAALGGAAGLVMAWWLTGVVVRLAPAEVPGLIDATIDGRVLAFTGSVTVATGLLFGLAPALHGARLPLASSLKEGGRASAGGRGRRLRDLLVVSEMALALVLLVGAGLLLRSLQRLQSVDPGFDASRLVTFNIQPPIAGYRDVPKRTRFFEEVLRRLAALPGVESVGATSELPFADGGLTPHNFVVEGRPPLRPGTEPELSNRAVSPAYFATVGLPLRRGRLLEESDWAEAPLVGVINDAAARAHFPAEDPLGRRVAWARADEIVWITVVGVVGDIRGTGLDQDEVPALYTPLAQELRWWKSWTNVAVRTSIPPGVLEPELRRQVSQVDAGVPLTRVRAMDDLLAASFAGRRFNLLLIGAFAALALVLAGIGLHGVLGYAVAQRTREIGVRVALGASPRAVVRLVVGQGLLLTAAGAAVGAAAALALTRSVSAMLFGVRTTDPATYLAVATLLAAVAALACYRPARRAARVDPLVALRGE